MTALSPAPVTVEALPATPVAWILHGVRLEAALAVAAIAFVVVGPRGGGAPLTYLIGGTTAAIAVVALLRPIAERRVLAITGILLIFSAVPVNRLTGVSNVLLTMLASAVVLTAVALRPSRGRFAYGMGAGIALVLVAGFVTAVSPDRQALLRFAPFVVTFLSMYLLGAELRGPERARVLRFLVALAVVESVLAVVEQLLGNPQLWAPSRINNLGVAVGLENPFLPGMFRSQGTLGNPLPLGLLLVVAIAALVRGTDLRRSVKVGLGSVLVIGLIFSGNRNSLILAVIVVAYFAARSFLIVRTVATTAGIALAIAIAAAVGLLNGAQLSDVAASGSVTHRSGAIDAFTRLLGDQQLAQVLLGNGWASSARLFASGLLQNDGFNAVDNMYVLMLGQGGVVCLGLLVGILVVSFIRGGRIARPMVFLMIATMFVFDLFVWPASAALAGLALAIARGSAADAEVDAAAEVSAPSTAPRLRSGPHRR